MEAVDCLLCGCADRRVRFRGRDWLYGGAGEFTVVECARCGFWYLSPRPDRREIVRYYPRDYRPFTPSLYEERSIFRSLDRMHGLRARCNVILRYRGCGHLLDVGCATGDFLAAMRAHAGWRVRGREPHPGAVAQARERHGLVVDEGDAEDLPYDASTFDVVTMWDVLEHVRDPVSTLRRVQRILRPGGLLVLSVPNRDAWDARLFGSHWAGLDVPRHFSVFSPRHLVRALEEAGFVDPEVQNLSGSFHAFALSVRSWLAGGSRWARIGPTIANAVDSTPLQLLTLPYFQLVKRLKRATSMVVIARTRSSSCSSSA
jgi:SAM-dependent methyltransferase